MAITTTLKQVLETAEAKALATTGPAGLNVVPVSMIKINDDSIWLFDFFMEKTATNVEAESTVSLTAWTNMVGVQVKGTVKYLTAGEEFTAGVNWCQAQNPDLVVKGLLVMTPTEVFDISPSGAFKAEELALT
jgi:predicted pyridoxine 5'-phosphate oxidase superfamily flavin-nucleotide-binding protein